MYSFENMLIASAETKKMSSKICLASALRKEGGKKTDTCDNKNCLAHSIIIRAIKHRLITQISRATQNRLPIIKFY